MTIRRRMPFLLGSILVCTGALASPPERVTASVVGRGTYSDMCGQTAGFAYVANAGGVFGNVSAYTIDGTTGALTPVAGSPFAAGSQPTSVTTTP